MVLSIESGVTEMVSIQFKQLKKKEFTDLILYLKHLRNEFSINNFYCDKGQNKAGQNIE